MTFRSAVLFGSVVALMCACERGGERHRAMPRILIVPIGTVEDDTTTRVQEGLADSFSANVLVAPAVPLPQHAFDQSRNQYLGDALLKALEQRDYVDADRVIGLVSADCYAPGLNFILGQARKPGRFAIVALPRLGRHLPRIENAAARRDERVLKVAIHELGHSLGFSHCASMTCVMRFANTVGEVDLTEARFCGREQPRW